MSTATDLATIEATIAENDLSDEEAALLRGAIGEGLELEEALAAVLLERAEQNGAAGPPPAPGEEPTDKQFAALGRENTRHEKRVREIMGDALEGFVSCEPCAGTGLVPPGPPPPEPQTHEFFRTCDTCAGFGEVLTGSIREGRMSRDCPACGGTGYLEALDRDGASLAERGAAPPPATPAPMPPATEPVPPPAGSPGAVASYGRPGWMGDPNIGA